MVRPRKTPWPSPAIIVAILALVAGVTGAAVAQPAAKKAVTKKKAKRIADKEIAKLAPGLSVASAADADALQGKPPSAFASKTSEPYRNVDTPGQPQFQGTWSNEPPSDGGPPAAFYKDPLGVVHLKGDVQNTVASASQSTIFVLPPGYRPSETQFFPWVISPEVNGVFAQPNGQVNAACSGGPCHPSLSGITFRAGS